MFEIKKFFGFFGVATSSTAPVIATVDAVASFSSSASSASAASVNSKAAAQIARTSVQGDGDGDIDEIPEGLLKARDALKSQIVNAREQLAQTQLGALGQRTMNRSIVSALYQATVSEASVTKAAMLLARVAPAAVMGLDEDARPDFLDPNASDAVLARKVTLYAALLEAGLSEQVSVRGNSRLIGGVEGGSLSAALLEATFDDWMIYGSYRPGFDDGELAKIDRLIANTTSGPLGDMDLLQTRFGLLLPVLANVHLWRIFQDMAPDVSANLGWCPQ